MLLICWSGNQEGIGIWEKGIDSTIVDGNGVNTSGSSITSFV
jgi:hypothetical protein